MGVCLSSSSSSSCPSPVKVIWMDGELREYAVPVRAEGVVGSGNEYFVCNSDSLYLDQPIPALRSNEELSPDDIYFVLHHSNRQRPLSAADMASLAFRASAALDAKKKKKKNKESRISPLVAEFNHPPHYDYHLTVNKNNYKKPSSSAPKLQRLASTRPKLAVRSFRLRLSTIYES